MSSKETQYKFVNYSWDDSKVASLTPVERLVYRSNILGDDQRITNTGGGNTSSKAMETDPLNGEQVEVLVLSIDTEAQRISLSMKALAASTEPAKKEESEPEAASAKSKRRAKPAGPLLGGLGRSTGDHFGLKW